MARHDDGPRLATAGANIAGANTDWVDPGNVTTDDGLYASVTVVLSSSDALAGTALGFAIPTGATIVGIKVELNDLGASGV